MSVGERIKELRKSTKQTQAQLAEKVGVSYIQIGRYETQKSSPSADVLQKLADALETTTDFLMQGSSDDRAASQLTDKELLEQFRQVEKLDKDDKHLIKTFIDAFLTKRQIQQLAR
jgi:transcriptional regulator with XRE-family HTH domain